MTPQQILALINAQIIANGVGAITAQILNNILTQIVLLFNTVAQTARIVSSSGTLVIALTDYRIGIQRVTSVTIMNAQLPTTTLSNQEFVIQDLAGNFNAFPVTVLPPAGQTICGAPNYVMNEDFQTGRFVYYGANVWGREIS